MSRRDRRRSAEVAAPLGDDPEFLYEDDEPRRRLSVLRVLIALVLVAGIGYGGFLGVRDRLASAAVVPGTWFAPYVDVTLTPTYQFQLLSDNGARQVALGFVVSSPEDPCTPSWGASYTLAQADQQLNLDSRIAQVRNEGASAIVSFGGQKNTSLAVGCTNQSALTDAFSTVIDRYRLSTIDLDVEGTALNNFAANRRLATAMASIQQTPGHQHLAVWLTLPVEPSGLQDNALSLISTMLRDHVAVAGINVMTMDFDNPTASAANMLGAVEQALSTTHHQLASLFPSFGVRLQSRELWNHMGATVMIGQNNIGKEQFTIADAQSLVRFADHSGLGRVSMWSLNRDSQCGTNFAETYVLSNTCSGVAQSNLGFSRILSQLTGTVSNKPGAQVEGVISVKPDLNPKDAPYPLWVGTQPYETGYKVVRSGYIYEAKWYNQGQDPAQPVQFAYESPWLLVGPVVPGDHAPAPPTLPSGTYPVWSLTTAYAAGEKVLLNGLPYEAKWATEGASPSAEAVDPGASPWQPLFNVPGEPAQS
jgi:chitinase